MEVRDFISCNEIRQLLVELKKSGVNEKNYSNLIGRSKNALKFQDQDQKTVKAIIKIAEERRLKKVK